MYQELVLLSWTVVAKNNAASVVWMLLQDKDVPTKHVGVGRYTVGNPCFSPCRIKYNV